jgi:hypothetical protein
MLARTRSVTVRRESRPVVGLAESVAVDPVGADELMGASCMPLVNLITEEAARRRGEAAGSKEGRKWSECG